MNSTLLGQPVSFVIGIKGILSLSLQSLFNRASARKPSPKFLITATLALRPQVSLRFECNIESHLDLYEL